MTPRHHTIWSVLLGAALLAGCGQADGGTTAPTTEPTTSDAAEPTTTDATEPTTDTAGPTTPAAPTDDDTTTATPAVEPSPSGSTGTATPASTAAGCDPAGSDLGHGIPNGAERVREAIGDLDGDDTPDQLVTWAVTLAEGETVFHLRVVTGSGHVAERELTEAGAMADVRPLGTVPIGDGHQAALVVEDVGASVELISVWGLHDWDDEPCSLGRMTIADDTAPVVFPVGATVGVTNGLACAEVEGVPTLAMRTVTASEDGETYDWQEAHLYWEGAGALRTASQDEGTFGADDERREQFASVDCPGIDP